MIRSTLFTYHAIAGTGADSTYVAWHPVSLCSGCSLFCCNYCTLPQHQLATRLCSTILSNLDYNNLLSSTTTVSTVTSCQERCLHTDGCAHFTFLTTAATEPSSTVCTLLRSCETSTLCSSYQNCTKALSGVRFPSISDACCSGLSGKACKADIISQHFQIQGGQGCR